MTIVIIHLPEHIAFTFRDRLPGDPGLMGCERHEPTETRREVGLHLSGLDAAAVATPTHLYIRVHLEGGDRNVELLEDGKHIADDTYRRLHRIDQASLDAGMFLRDLSSDEVLAHLLSNQAVTLSKSGRVKEALPPYDAALELAPQLVAAWYNRGLDLMGLERLEEALSSFDEAIRLYPSDAQAHNIRGLARLEMGGAAGARKDFERALELTPGLVEAEENLKRLQARTVDE